MKTRFLKALVLRSKQRGGIALLSFVCLLSFAITQGSAQAQNPKRITALQLGNSAEGSRVTIVSDLALNDYEAFRRGDRFYVKIPIAEFKSALPHCCANGFEDVQVQKIGDSVVVSFRLQPGATARVDQRSNRLEVIFSSPNRAFRNNAANQPSNRLIPTGTNVSRMSPYRGPDSAGPTPPGSTPGFRERVVTDRTRPSNEGRALSRLQAPRSDLGNAPNRSSTSGDNQRTSRTDQSVTASNQSATTSTATRSPSPVASASSTLAPGNTTSNPASLTSASPAPSVVSQPGIDSTTSVESAGSANWKTRSKAAVQWVSKNRLATLLAALILLSLLLYFVMALVRRRKKSGTARLNELKAQPKVQPKESLVTDFEELLRTGPVKSAPSSDLSKEVVKPPAVAPAVAAAAAPQSHSWLPTKPPVASTSTKHEHGSDEEREVFEL